MPDRQEPVGQDDFDQHVTPIVPDGTGVGRATQGSLPPVEWEPVGQDAPDVGWGRVFGHNRREFTGRPGTRRCETGHREADGCITFCVLEHGHDTREGHIYELHFAHAPDPNSTQAEVRRLREELDQMLSVLRHLNRKAWGKDTMISGFRKWVAERTAPFLAAAPGKGEG